MDRKSKSSGGDVAQGGDGTSGGVGGGGVDGRLRGSKDAGSGGGERAVGALMVTSLVDRA